MSKPESFTPTPVIVVNATMGKLGDFSLLRELGRGGSGVVYEARWGHRGVALKVLHPELTPTDKIRQQFLLEAQRLSELTHAGVVKVLTFGVFPDGRPYLAMEHLQGESLAERLAKGPVALDLTLALLSQLADAVHAMHGRGLVHRDLKPENVFLVDQRHAVLLDFGIAKDMFAAPSTTTQDGGVRGTPAYMAPERFFGQQASVATDVYEFAVVAYAMISGCLPWDNLNDPAARLNPAPLPNGPMAIDVVLRQAMSTRAANRPASVAELALRIAVAAGEHIGDGSANQTQPMSSQNDDPAADQLELALAHTVLHTPPLATPPPRVTAASASGTPWFERSTTGGKPPRRLENASVLPVPSAAATTRRMRTSKTVKLAAVGVTGLAVIAAGFAMWQRHASVATLSSAPVTALVTPTVAPLANDPWAPPADQQLSTASARSETAGDTKHQQATLSSLIDRKRRIAAAIDRIPADINVVAIADIAVLRGRAEVTGLLQVVAKEPQIAMLMTLVPSCLVNAIAGADAAIVGARAFHTDKQAVLFVQGQFSDEGMVACLQSTSATKSKDAQREWKIAAVGTIAFNQQELVLSTYAKQPASALLTAHGPRALAKRPAELLSRLPEHAALRIVADADSTSVLSPEIPRGTDAFVSVDFTTESNIALQIAGETMTAAEATALAESCNKAISSVGGLLRLKVEQLQRQVQIKGELPAALLQLAGAALAKR